MGRLIPVFEHGSQNSATGKRNKLGRNAHIHI